MADKNGKQTFLHGAALLALATAIVKVIGALYKIPLKMVIGDEGYAYFMTAYDIYTVLLMISTTGLPVAMSRLISQASSLGNAGQIRRVYNTAKALFLGIGGVSTLLMGLLCRQLAVAQQQPDAWFAIVCLAPCAFLMGYISTYRGFFQGQGNMIPTSVSQVLEALVKLLVGLGAALVILFLSGGIPYAAGGAILGVTASCVVSVVYLFFHFRKAYAQLPESSGEVDGWGVTMKRLLSIAVPITVGSAGLQLLTVLETGLYMDRIVGLLEQGTYDAPVIGEITASIVKNDPGLTAAELHNKIAANLKGIFNMTQTVYNMPISFIAPITISIIPAITSQLTLSNHAAAKATEESAARVTGLLSLPCAVGLMVLSKPIMSLLGGYSGVRAELAGQLMTLIGVSVFLHAVVQVTNAIMQAHGHAHVPVVNMLCAGTVRLVLVFILAGNPEIGILGVPVGTSLCNLAIGVLNLMSMNRYIEDRPAIVKNVLRPLIPAALMGVAAWGSWYALTAVLGENVSRIIQCGVPIALAVVVYFGAVVVFRVLTREDCLLLPKGEKIAKLLRL